MIDSHLSWFSFCLFGSVASTTTIHVRYLFQSHPLIAEYSDPSMSNLRKCTFWFYVAAEHDEILEHFKYPPNVFDNFIQIDKLILQNDLHNIKNSISWKITSPLRKMRKIVFKFLKTLIKDKKE
jgi:hypothetical protein